MTAPIPGQLRALADQVDGYSWGDDPEVATALRAAADQLEAVQGLYSQDWNDIDDERWEDEWSRGRMSALRDVRAILTTDTAPQEDQS